MTNKERQKSLDRQKWYLSENAKTDMSGKLIWCECCEGNNNGLCIYTQDSREKLCLCAKAWNRLQRKENN